MANDRIDLDDLERLAKAATPGPYTITHENDVGPNDEGFWEWFAIAPKGYEHITTIAKCEHGQFRDEHDKVKANAEHLAALDPATVLELVRLARVGRRAAEQLGLLPESVEAEIERLLDCHAELTIG